MKILSPAMTAPRLALVIVAALVVLQALAPPAGRSLLLATLHDSAHVPWFAALTLLLCFWFSRVRLPAQRWLLPLCLIVLAIGTELAQALLVNRVPSIADCARNLIGAGLGWLVWAWRGRPLVLAGALLLGFLVTIAHPLSILWAKSVRTGAYPVLFSTAQSGWQLLLGRSGDARTRAVTIENQGLKQAALEVSVTEQPWPGILLLELSRRLDGYHSLVIDVALATEQPIRWYVGSRHVGEGSGGATRSRSMMLAPGLQRVRIPLSVLTPAGDGNAEVAVLLLYSVPAFAGARWQLLQVTLE